MFWKTLSKLKPIGAPILENYLRSKDRVKLAWMKAKGEGTVKALLNPEHIVSSKIVIFVAYPPATLASMHTRLLSRFEDAGYSILFVSNHPDPDYVFSSCMDQRWTFMFRRPFGRDFGGFRDATLYLHDLTLETGRRFKKVVYLNDSVATIDRYESAIVSHLDKEDEEFSGITENYDKGLHVGSFVMSVGERAFYHKKLIKYWKKFKNLSTRRYAIGKGELGFSKTMRRAGFVPDVLWTLARMKPALLRKSTSELLRISEAMEPHFQRRTESPIDVIQNRVSKFHDGKLSHFPDSTVNKKLPGSIGHNSTSRDGEDDLNTWQSRRAVEFAREDLVNHILRYIFRGSQIHHGAAPLLFIGAGLIKKDVVLRKIVEPFDIEILLQRTGASTEESIEISRDILAKSHPYALRGWTKVLNDWDFI